MSDSPVVSISEVRRIAVLGSGTMGNGIAHVAAQAGYEVAMYDIDGGALDAAMNRIRANFDAGVARGKVAPELRDAAVARLRTSTELARCVAEADVVIEAVPENMDLKRKLFAAVTAAAPARALLATNTSSLSVADIAQAVPVPAHVVGMHFFNPVHIMKLVEVIYHDTTSPAALDCARSLGEKFGKTAITVKDVPGFASSRLGLAIGLEAMRMVEQGVASAADIDTAMRLGYGHPMGPLELTDIVGLDVRMNIADYLTGQLGDAFRPPQVLRDKVAAGKLGKKTGEGFYVWKDGKRVA